MEGWSKISSNSCLRSWLHFTWWGPNSLACTLNHLNPALVCPICSDISPHSSLPLCVFATKNCCCFLLIFHKPPPHTHHPSVSFPQQSPLHILSGSLWPIVKDHDLFKQTTLYSPSLITAFPCAPQTVLHMDLYNCTITVMYVFLTPAILTCLRTLSYLTFHTEINDHLYLSV